MKLNKKLSRNIGRRIHARPHACWLNAVRALSHLAPGALYVEGWAFNGASQEHAWVELGRQIIDPSPGWIDNDAIYFAALRYTSSDLNRIFGRLADSAGWFTADFPITDRTNPEYARAGALSMLAELAQCKP